MSANGRHSDELQALLSAYATGTLAPAERERLFQAALEDQTLFDALFQEQALKESLDDPAFRADVLSALDAPQSRWAWLRRPWPWSLAGAAALATVALVLLRPMPPSPRESSQTTTVAQRRDNAAAPPVQQPEAQPAVPPATRRPAAPKPRLAAPAPASAPAPQAKTTAATDTSLAAPPSPPRQDAPPQAEITSAQADTAPLASAPGVVGGVPGSSAAEPKPALSARTLFESELPTLQAGNAFREEARRRQAAPMASRARLTASPSLRGLRFRVLAQKPDNSREALPPDQPLPAGRPLTLEWQANLAGFLYVLERGPDNNWRPLLPVEQAPVSAGAVRTVTLPGQPGEHRLLVVLSPQALTPEQVATRAGTSQPGRLEQPANPPEPAVYVVSPGTVVDEPILRVR